MEDSQLHHLVATPKVDILDVYITWQAVEFPTFVYALHGVVMYIKSSCRSSSQRSKPWHTENTSKVGNWKAPLRRGRKFIYYQIGDAISLLLFQIECIYSFLNFINLFVSIDYFFTSNFKLLHFSKYLALLYTILSFLTILW